MKLKILFICSLSLASFSTQAQQAVRKIGDLAPGLNIKEWVKGTPIDSFKKGKVYVLDFWATWCGPCLAAMPHLSALANQYNGQATFAAIDVKESYANFARNDKQIKDFVDQIGNKMSLNVGLMEDTSTVRNWLDAFQIRSIPTSYIIDGQGRVAWIGNPSGVDTVLQKITNNTWDIDKELVEVKYNRYLETLDSTLASKAERFSRWSKNLGDMGSPDSTLKIVNQMTGIEKNLRYMPKTTYYTFSALLKTDTCKAYEFGEQALTSSLPAFKMDVREALIDAIRDDMRKFSTPTQIMAFGAECLRARVIAYNNVHNLSFNDMAEEYKEIAEWYRRGAEKAKALEAEKTAVQLWQEDLQMDETRIGQK